MINSDQQRPTYHSAVEPDGATDEAARGSKVVRLLVEAAIGIALALAILAAVIASTGEIPFVYQGY
jgi:hypothetical protein